MAMGTSSFSQPEADPWLVQDVSSFGKPCTVASEPAMVMDTYIKIYRGQLKTRVLVSHYRADFTLDVL